MAYLISYSGQDFDTVTQAASILTNEDRLNGLPAPAAGYSEQNVRDVEAVMAIGQGKMPSAYVIADLVRIIRDPEDPRGSALRSLKKASDGRRTAAY